MKTTRRAMQAVIFSLSFVVCGSVGAAQSVIWQATASRTLAISPDAQLMLTGNQLRHTSDGSVIRTFNTGYSSQSSVNQEVFSPDGTLAAIAVQAYNRNLLLIRVADGVRLAAPITAHTNGATCVTFSPDGTLLASGGRDGTVKIWSIPGMTLLKTLNGGVGYRPRVFAVVFSKDGAMVGVGGQGGIVVYRVADGQLLGQLTTVDTISFALSPDGTLLASGSDEVDQYGQCVDCSIKIWRTADAALILTIPGNNNGITSLAFSPDQKELAAGAGDRVYNGSVRFFDVATGKLLTTWLQDSNNPGSYVTTVAYAPFGRLFAYARADAHVIAAFDPF